MWVVQDILLTLVLVLVQVLGSLVDGYGYGGGGYGSTLAFAPCSPSKSGTGMQIADLESWIYVI